MDYSLFLVIEKAADMQFVDFVPSFGQSDARESSLKSNYTQKNKMSYTSGKKGINASVSTL